MGYPCVAVGSSWGCKIWTYHLKSELVAHWQAMIPDYISLIVFFDKNLLKDLTWLRKGHIHWQTFTSHILQGKP